MGQAPPEMVTISRAEYEPETGLASETGSPEQEETLWGVLRAAGRRADGLIETRVAAHTRRSSWLEERLPDNVPVEVVEHRIPGNELNCPVRGTAMMEIGRDVRRTLVMIPAQVRIREDIYFTYACPKCK